jgi:hypothetical protein
VIYRLQLGGVVPALEPNELLLDRFQFRRHRVQALEAFALNLFIRYPWQRRMYLHELQSDLLAGFFDLADGSVAFHSTTIKQFLAKQPKRPKGQKANPLPQSLRRVSSRWTAGMWNQ